MLEVILVLVLMFVSFFFGAFVTFLGNTSMCRKYSKEICVKMLLILHSINENMKKIDSEKYIKMKESGFSNNAIKGQRNIDSYDLQKWRNDIITQIITRYPFPQDLKFRDYDGALDFMHNYYAELSNIPPKEKLNKQI
tara:strand:- start:1034 stop:1447 length:414 start_codon:yes stop_codon:yes gene_type:complete